MGRRFVMSQSSFQGFLSPRPDKKGGINPIKSTQTGAATLSGGTVNVTISTVDITKSVVLVYPKGNTNISTALITGSLTSSTNAQFSSSLTSASLFDYLIIEFGSIKSFQSGSVGVTTSASVTITSVNTAKSFLFYNFNSSGSSTNLIDSFLAGFLNSATSLSFTTAGAATLIAQWYVVETY
jgi:hypothetical protein